MICAPLTGHMHIGCWGGDGEVSWNLLVIYDVLAGGGDDVASSGGHYSLHRGH